MSSIDDPRSLDDRSVSGTSRSTGAPVGDQEPEPRIQRPLTGAKCVAACRQELERRTDHCARIADPERRLLCMAEALGEYSACVRHCGK